MTTELNVEPCPFCDSKLAVIGNEDNLFVTHIATNGKNNSWCPLFHEPVDLETWNTRNDKK